MVKVSISILLIIFTLNIGLAQDSSILDTSFTASYVSDCIPNAYSPAKDLVRSSAIPVGLLAVGGYTIGERGIYSSFDFRRDISPLSKRYHYSLDEYLKYSTIAGYGALKLTNIPSKHNIKTSALLAIQSQLIMMGMVYSLKYATGIQRPDGTDLSFPSGHTAQAFLGAALIDQEYRKTYPWLVASAYGIASLTGFLRILRDRHWMSDVLAGAGCGILSVNFTYWTHRYLENKKKKRTFMK